MSCGSVQTINGVKISETQKQTPRKEIAIVVLSFGFGYWIGHNHKTPISKWHNQP